LPNKAQHIIVLRS